MSHRVFEDYPPQFPSRNPAQRAVAGPIIIDGKLICDVGRCGIPGRLGLEREVAQAIADGAHQTCPYSKATRGNIDVVIIVV